MDNKQFDICLDFHLGLIRCTPLDKTIDDARKINEKNIDTGPAARNLFTNLVVRKIAIEEWADHDNDGKEGLYNQYNSRNPKPEVFTAAFDVINGKSGISLAARLNGVNYQSVKVLIPRLKRWDEFAKKLAKTL
jgi:hypothetical protein